MSRNLLSEFMYHLDVDGEMDLGHAPDDVIEWIESLGLPMSIRRFLQWDWAQTDGQIGHIHIMSSSNVRTNDWSDTFTPQKLLWLGSAPNGDFFVINFSDDRCIPGFVTHSECWDGNGGMRSDLVSCFQPIARSMQSLLYRFAEALYIPTDYYSAKEFNKFLETETNR